MNVLADEYQHAFHVPYCIFLVVEAILFSQGAFLSGSGFGFGWERPWE